MKEQRKLERRNTDAFLAVYDRNTEMFIGRLIDMTTKGMKIKSATAIELDSTFQIRIDLPVDLKLSKIIRFKAKCVWTKECSDSDAYDSGLEVQDITPKELENISSLINSPLFKDANERVRVTIGKITT
ncbi:MAG: PilZ domain-containing protein [candidate division Zixibacteria bacterium]|nr:PilZ domain-containing protein [candidate division Zixibacteria bacterium]